VTSGIIDENIMKKYKIRDYHERADEKIVTLLKTQPMKLQIEKTDYAAPCAYSAEKG